MAINGVYILLALILALAMLVLGRPLLSIRVLAGSGSGIRLWQHPFLGVLRSGSASRPSTGFLPFTPSRDPPGTAFPAVVARDADDGRQQQ